MQQIFTRHKIFFVKFQNFGQLVRRKLHTTVFSQSYSPCGKYLATCDNFGSIQIFRFLYIFDRNTSLSFVLFMVSAVIQVINNLTLNHSLLVRYVCSLSSALSPDASEDAWKPIYAFSGEPLQNILQFKILRGVVHDVVGTCVELSLYFSPLVCHLLPHLD